MPLTVLLSIPGLRPTTNPYLVQLVRSLRAAGVDVRFFSFGAALFGRYDVVHLHWPENLLRGSSGGRTLVRRLLVLGWLVRLRLTSSPVVRTLHNVEQHEEVGPTDRWLLDRLAGRTKVSIRLNECTPIPSVQAAVTIPHGHYREWYAEYPRSPATPGRIAYIGLIRDYKAVDTLVEAFLSCPGDFGLTVSGQPRTPQLAERLATLASEDERILLELEYVSDATLVARVSGAQLVVLPYRRLHNSGGALAALSLDRPVLVPRNDVTEVLAAEVGPGWVHTFEGDLSAADLARVLAADSRIQRSDRPDLSAREWASAGEDHVRAYRQALDSGARRRRRRTK